MVGPCPLPGLDILVTPASQLLYERLPRVMVTACWRPWSAAGSEEGAFFGGGSGGVALDEGYIPADTPERDSPERSNGSLQCVSGTVGIVPRAPCYGMHACCTADHVLGFPGR